TPRETVETVETVLHKVCIERIFAASLYKSLSSVSSVSHRVGLDSRGPLGENKEDLLCPTYARSDHGTTRPTTTLSRRANQVAYTQTPAAPPAHAPDLRAPDARRLRDGPGAARGQRPALSHPLRGPALALHRPAPARGRAPALPPDVPGRHLCPARAGSGRRR